MGKKADSQKADAKSRAAADAAKHNGGSTNASSFNASAYGKSFEQAFNAMDPATQAAAAVVLSQTQKNALISNQPAPAVLDDKELKKLWSQAENDSTISQTYANELALGKDTFLKQVDLFSSDYAQLTDKEKQDYVEAKQNLESTAAQSGQAYSGFRKQAQDKLEKSQSDIISSSTRQAQSNLNQLQSQFEQKYGTTALQGLNVGTVKAGTATPVGMQANWTAPSTTDISYKPTGGVVGTQAQSKLADITAQDQELQQQALQKQTQSNYEDWQKQLKKAGQIA